MGTTDDEIVHAGGKLVLGLHIELLCGMTFPEMNNRGETWSGSIHNVTCPACLGTDLPTDRSMEAIEAWLNT